MNVESTVMEKIKMMCKSRVDNVTVESLLVEELGFDSLSLIDLCMEIEDEFDIELDDMDIVGVMTVKNLIDACEKAIASAE